MAFPGSVTFELLNQSAAFSFLPAEIAVYSIGAKTVVAISGIVGAVGILRMVSRPIAPTMPEMVTMVLAPVG